MARSIQSLDNRPLMVPDRYQRELTKTTPIKTKGFMSQEQLDNAQFEEEVRRRELKDVAEKLMSENPQMAQEIQTELSRRFKLDPRRMSQDIAKVQTPQGRAALTMFG